MSAREVVGKCDLWIATFKDVFDKFKSILKSKRVTDNHIQLNIDCYQIISMYSNKKSSGLDLKLSHYGSLFHEGITLNIDNDLMDIYKYLVANVVEFFLVKEYSTRSIDLSIFCWTLASEDGNMFLNLSSLQGVPGMAEMIYQLIAVHNTGVTNEQIFSSLIEGIDDAVVGELFDSSITKAQNDIKLLGKVKD